MRKVFYIFLFLIMASGACVTNECICPDLYAPVCGSNGDTYTNPCLAECDDVEYIDGECPVYGIGQVNYSGDTICGFYISILGTEFKPQNLPDEYKVPDITVGLRYRKMNSWYTCDQPYIHVQEIAILEIEKIGK